MKVVIVVRMAADYANMTTESFEAQLAAPYKPATELKIFLANNILQLWNNTFRMNYFKYRHRLAQLSMDTLKATGCKILVGYEDFCRWYKHDTEDAIIVPIDDDDWLAPNIADVASHFDDKTKVVMWRNTVLHSITRYQVSIGDGFKLYSNNWAVKKSFLKTLDYKKARHTVLMSHYHADKFIKQELPKSERKTIDEHYSIYNRHPASLSFIRHKIDELDFYSELPKIAKRPVVLCEPPDIMEWCRPYLSNMYVLSLQLRNLVIKI